MASRLKGAYFIWDGSLLYVGPGGRSSFHSHHLIQIGMSVDVLRLRVGDEPFTRCRGFVLDSDVPHQIVCAGREPIYFIWVDPESDVAGRLYQKLPEMRGGMVQVEGVGSMHVAETCAEAARARTEILSALGAMAGETRQIDERVRGVLQSIQIRLTEDAPTVEALAEEVFLSPSRLMHLFSDQVGIPIRRYVLWRRIMIAVQGMAKGQSMTEAAFESGFSDSAHLSRTFRDMFGISPSELFKNSRFVQATACEPL